MTPERCNKLFESLNLETLESWPAGNQEKAVELLKEFHHLFALNDLKLGCTSEVKHTIKLTDPVPLKQRYRRIPPHQFQEVKNHLEEMLKVGAISQVSEPMGITSSVSPKERRVFKILYQSEEAEFSHSP